MADQKIEKPNLLKQEEILPKEESAVEADRKASEAQPESKDVFLEKEETHVSPVKTAAPTPAPTPAARNKDEAMIEVEKIMEEGLGDFYSKMPPAAQQKFKAKGEETANELAKMVRSLSIKFKQALHLVRDWLLTIPGVNKFFLEQEAKIKVDKLTELVQERKREKQKLP